MFASAGLMGIVDDHKQKPSLVSTINNQLNLQGRNTFKGLNNQNSNKNHGGPRLTHSNAMAHSSNGTAPNNQRYNYENRVVQAHRELQQFFQKFDTENDAAETGESNYSQHKSSNVENCSDKDKNSDKQPDKQKKSKELISAKAMLEQRKRAVTHSKRMQNYNQQNAQRRQTTQETRKQNAFVLYDLKNIEMLQADSESSDGGDD